MTTPVHPFVGEGFSYERSIQYWDDIADTYSNLQQGTIPKDIVDYLVDEKILSEDTEAIELGSGPGTYSIQIAPRIRSLTCVDTSPRMLERLKRIAQENNIDNITTINSDFNALPNDKRYDTVVSALCPGTGSKGSISKMESLSKQYCVHVMWIENHWDDIHAQMWKALGKDYSFSARKDSVISNMLIEMDRVHEVREFSSEVKFEMPKEQAIAKEMHSFDAYDLDVDVSSAVRDVLEPMFIDDVFHYEWTNKMRLIIWEAPQC